MGEGWRDLERSYRGAKVCIENMVFEHLQMDHAFVNAFLVELSWIVQIQKHSCPGF